MKLVKEQKKVLKAAIPVLMMLVICACGRLESEQIDMDYFFGSWQEYFGPDYQVEGGRTWHIREDIITVYTYDWYSDTEWEWNLNYSLEQNKGKYIVSLEYQEDPETNNKSYYIIKLTDEEMIWQRVDAEGDKMHFVNGKYWANHRE